MSQKEGDFWRNTVKPQFDAMELLYARIESPLTPGFPDTVVSYQGNISLIELKSREKFEKLLGCSPVQKIFLNRWGRNSKAFVLTRIGEEIYFIRGTRITHELTFESLQEYALVSGPSRGFMWERLLIHLHR